LSLRHSCGTQSDFEYVLFERSYWCLNPWRSTGLEQWIPGGGGILVFTCPKDQIHTLAGFPAIAPLHPSPWRYSQTTPYLTDKFFPPLHLMPHS
jgi:hypothetical protein